MIMITCTCTVHVVAVRRAPQRDALTGLFPDTRVYHLPAISYFDHSYFSTGLSGGDIDIDIYIHLLKSGYTYRQSASSYALLPQCGLRWPYSLV